MEKLKELREKTGAGMADCKKALDEAAGDIQKAVEILRKKGIAKASKRVGRNAIEGLIKVGVNSEFNKGYILEVNAETDFVVRNEKFQAYVDKVFEIIKTNSPKDIEDLKALSSGEATVQEVLDNLSGTIGEKMVIKRYEIISTKGTVAAYTHMQGRIGVLVALDQADKTELAHDVAMQVAAANPQYLNSTEVPSAEVDKEKEIYKEQLLKENKPENIIEKIMIGKINKYYTEVCLLNQEFIKDDKKSIKDILGEVKIEKFVRFSL